MTNNTDKKILINLLMLNHVGYLILLTEK